jgi:hypothetical protein
MTCRPHPTNLPPNSLLDRPRIIQFVARGLAKLFLIVILSIIGPPFSGFVEIVDRRSASLLSAKAQICLFNWHRQSTSIYIGWARLDDLIHHIHGE